MAEVVDDAELPVLSRLDSDDEAERPRLERPRILTPLILTAITVACTAGLGAVLLAWLVSHHAVQGQSTWQTLRTQHAFVVDEGTRDNDEEARLVGLTISSVTSTLVAFTIPFMMTIYAYRVASAWISASQKTTRLPDRDLPTPLQYGLVLRLLGSASLLSLTDTVAYFCRRRKPSVPSMLQNAFGVCFFTLLITHLIGLADIWIHSTTHAILRANFTAPSPVLGSMSTVFNDSLCAGSIPQVALPCLQSPDGWGYPEVLNPGYLLASNSSTEFSVVTLHDHNDTALVVPAVVSSDIVFNATSFASRAKCTSLNSRCKTDSSNGQNVVTNCSNIGYSLPFQNTKPTTIIPKFILEGGYTSTNQPAFYNENPIELVIQLTWPTDTGATSPETFNSAVDADWSNATMSLYASCNYTFFNVSYSYANGAFDLLSEEIMNVNASNIFLGPLTFNRDPFTGSEPVEQLANARLASDLQATAQSETNADNVMAALEQELSRLGIAMMGGTYLNSTANVQQQQVIAKTLGRYAAAPVLTFIALLWLYGLFAIYIFVRTVLSLSPVLAAARTAAPADNVVCQLDLAHTRLTNPLPLVADLFHPESARLKAELSTQQQAMDMFAESSATSRLIVGVGEGKYGIYGLHRRFEGEGAIGSAKLEA